MVIADCLMAEPIGDSLEKPQAASSNGRFPLFSINRSTASADITLLLQWSAYYINSLIIILMNFIVILYAK